MARGDSATAHAGWILLLLIAREKDEACESSCRTGRPAEEAVPNECECESPLPYPKDWAAFFFFLPEELILLATTEPKKNKRWRKGLDDRRRSPKSYKMEQIKEREKRRIECGVCAV